MTWVCSCMTFQYFGQKLTHEVIHFYILPKLERSVLKLRVFGAKLAFIAGIFLKNYSWCMKIHFQFHFFAIWSISGSILSIIEWKAPASNWPPSELAMFFKNNFWCFGLFGKFQDTIKISMWTARVLYGITERLGCNEKLKSVSRRVTVELGNSITFHLQKLWSSFWF